MEGWSQLRQLVQNRGRMEGGMSGRKGRLNCCILLQTLTRLEGVQSYYDSLFQMQNIKDLLAAIKLGQHTVD